MPLVSKAPIHRSTTPPTSFPKPPLQTPIFRIMVSTNPSPQTPSSHISHLTSSPSPSSSRNLLSSSNNFIVYLSAYSVFLSSIAGVIICDYYLVRRGYLITQALYSARPSSPYYFTLGFHWRGYAAYICGILINIVGFVGAIGKPVPRGARYLYNVNFFCGFIVASGTYWALCCWFPIPGMSKRWREEPWEGGEEGAEEGAEGGRSGGHVVVGDEESLFEKTGSEAEKNMGMGVVNKASVN